MKFLFIRLTQYIGIYNGLNLTEIAIDFSICKHRVILLKGDNGSGKTTIMNALDVFPNSNDQFVPNKEAIKEIVLEDHGQIYNIKFIHGVHFNSEDEPIRDVTKAYVSKMMPNGTTMELNENGNVSSYKDIISNELDLDANFTALATLSSLNRGLADKKPAERKRLVISVMQDVETYNNINKALSKKFNMLKAMIQSISSKLNSIGDIESVKLSIENLDLQIQSLTAKRDDISERIAMSASTIQLLDPDGSISNKSMELDNIKKDLIHRSSSIDKSIKRAIEAISPFGYPDQRTFDALIVKKETAIVDNQVLRSRLETMLADRDARANQLSQKGQRLQSLVDSGNYDKIIDQIKIYEEELKKLDDQIGKSGISDASVFTQDGYIMALETLKDVNEQFNTLRSFCDYSTISSIVDMYLSTGTIPKTFNVAEEEAIIATDKASIDELNIQIAKLATNIELCAKLDLRPNDCKNDACPFIADVVGFDKESLIKSHSNYSDQLEQTKLRVEENESMLSLHSRINVTINTFRVIIREIDKNKSILSRLPDGGLFTDKARFCFDLISGQYSEYAEKIYGFIDIANLFDIYHNIKDSLNELNKQRAMYESKQDYIDEVDKEIRQLRVDMKILMDRIDPTYTAIDNNNRVIEYCDSAISKYRMYLTTLDEFRTITDQWGTTMIESNKYRDSIDRMQECLYIAKDLKKQQAELDNQMMPIRRERDRLSQLTYIHQSYLEELTQLQSRYEYIDTIRRFSSPTMGIQLVFMDMYMGTVMDTANELISILFNGKFALQKFIITDNEFKIPCRGNGLLNDDISSMSGGEAAMISMILSFSLLHTSSSRFNIPKMDEIDGSLDTMNRALFVEVSNRIMDIMGTEQCFIISHNTELMSEDTDIIQLKMENTDDSQFNGNIIWKY